MIEVYVSRLMPTYGASRRPARISSIRTAAEHTNTSAAATILDIGAVLQPRGSLPGRRTRRGDEAVVVVTERETGEVLRRVRALALHPVLTEQHDHDEVVTDFRS